MTKLTNAEKQAVDRYVKIEVWTRKRALKRKDKKAALRQCMRIEAAAFEKYMKPWC